MLVLEGGTTKHDATIDANKAIPHLKIEDDSEAEDSLDMKVYANQNPRDPITSPCIFRIARAARDVTRPKLLNPIREEESSRKLLSSPKMQSNVLSGLWFILII